VKGNDRPGILFKISSVQVFFYLPNSTTRKNWRLSSGMHHFSAESHPHPST